MQDLPNGGGGRPEGASRVGLCGGGGGKHWPPGAGDPRYTTGSCDVTPSSKYDSSKGAPKVPLAPNLV